MVVLENNDVLSDSTRRAAVLEGLHEPFDSGSNIAFIVNPVGAIDYEEALAEDFVGHWICISLHPNEHRVEIRDSLKDGDDHTDIARQLGNLFF